MARAWVSARLSALAEVQRAEPEALLNKLARHGIAASAGQSMITELAPQPQMDDAH